MKILEIRLNNSGMGKNGTRRKLKLCFISSLFHSKQKANITVLVILNLGLPHIITLITFLTNVFTAADTSFPLAANFSISVRPEMKGC